MSALLLDIGPLSCGCTDHVLESIYKAISDPPDEHDIWEPHHSPFIRELVERFTAAGILHIGAIRDELLAILKGERYKPGERITRPHEMERWGAQELDLVRLYLESLPPEDYALEDWSMAVDYLVQRYLPHDFQMEQSRWIATKAVLMGRMQAVMETLTERQAERLLNAVPRFEAASSYSYGALSVQQAIIEYGRARVAENITSLTQGLRSKIKQTVLDHQFQSKLAGDYVPETLESKLVDDFALLNRDWRRIALTEAAELSNQGFVSSFAPGTRLKRVEQYRGACPFCRKIDGTIMTVVDPGKPNKDGRTEVWAGKTNIGRSASPRKRVGSELIEREPDELWWVAAGTIHPHCRGMWVRQDPLSKPTDDPEFTDWIKQVLRGDA